MKTALVISGGGSRGAFAVGAIEVLRHRVPRFDVVAGTSTGALIAPLVVSDDLPLLRSIYSSVRTEDIIRKRNVFEILTRDSIYDSHPLWSLLNSFVTEVRYQRIISSPTEMFVATVNLQSGGLKYWNQHTSGDGGGPLTREMLLRALMASASEPVLMPPIEIPEGGDQYVDGGVREIAPLKIAIDQGATDIYAIVLAPEKPDRAEERYHYILQMITRTANIFTQEVLLNDVRHARVINEGVRHLAGLRKKAAELLSEETVAEIFDDPSNPNPFRSARVVNVHMIRPEHEPPSAGLEFRPVVMSQMMEMGRKAAQNLLNSLPQQFIA